MKKKFDEAAIVNELKGGSAFFKPPSIKEEPKKEAIQEVSSNQETNQESINDTMIPQHHDTTVSRSQEEILETLRRAVKQLGKEAATYRFTQEEKKALADIVYTETVV